MMAFSGIIGLIILVLDVMAIIKTLNSTIPPIEKLLWIVVIILLPVVGLILWYFIGPSGRGGAL